MSTEPCARDLCGNDADGRDYLCAPCRAADNLLLAVNTALEAFLADRFPPPADDNSPLLDNTSPVRVEIFEASADLTHGVLRLIELAIGRRVGTGCGAWVDPFTYRWRGGVEWDISEEQDDITERTPR